MKKIATIIFLFIISAVPVFVFAKIIPDCSPDCGYYHLLELVNNIIDWIIMISVPVAAGVFAWAGFKYMTSGVVDQKAAAKSMLQKVFFGFVFILAAWLIVSTILKALLKDTNIVPVDIGVIKLINIYA